MHRHLRIGRLLSTVVMIGLLTSPSARARSGIDRLDRLKGSTRPIVLLSDSMDDPRVRQQIALFDREKRALDDRDIKVLREAKPGYALRQRLDVGARGFAIVLVGKDGDVKAVWHEVVDPGRIFDLIDQMPMRRAEIRKRKSKG